LSWCGMSELAVAGSKSSSTVATMLVVETAGAARRLERPATEEDCRGGRRGLSTVSTPPEVDAPGAANPYGLGLAEEKKSLSSNYHDEEPS
jgi:hypothetical protein